MYELIGCSEVHVFHYHLLMLNFYHFKNQFNQPNLLLKHLKKYI